MVTPLFFVVEIEFQDAAVPHVYGTEQVYLLF